MKQAKPKLAEKKKIKNEKRAENTDSRLFAELKALRRELADEKDVPAYVIFSNATLVDMCRKIPTTVDELLDISGVGKVKAEQYGERFLQTIRAYCRDSSAED